MFVYMLLVYDVLVFFFKQKTAYEMRISDWSSDVCSSDLYEEMKIKLLNGSHLALTYLGFLRGYRFVHETMDDPLFVEYIRRYMDEDVTPQLAPVPGIEIGRAAFRERVCQYV